MFALKVGTLILMHVDLALCIILVRLTRPGLWEVYQSDGIPETTLKTMNWVSSALTVLVGCTTGCLIALFRLVK